jgi:hypothetical protein
VLIWETTVSEKQDLEEIAAHAIGSAECLQRDDGKAGLVLCNDGISPEQVLAWKATLLFQGGCNDPGSGPWIFAVGIWTPEDWHEELCAWYQYEHGPILLQCPEWQGFQVLEAKASSGCQFFVHHRLSKKTALDSAQRSASRQTPWFKRLAKNDWFDGKFERSLYRRISLIWHDRL